ncbi:FtsX-like permease family protein [Brevibacillus migulae]|uniref:FtsX-like permease family protein n=1 Tax=Brevibacillus migulae TaxID=1644114 RepID=UPI00106E9F27|nr:ABC transporter permease [Brevibacillus migulae]
MTFRQFAFNNVVRNRRMYAAFFLSSTFSVMVFFMYAMFSFHPGIVDGEIHWSAAIGMGVAQYVIYLFAFFFLFYSVSAFLKKREKEFGILTVHGMSQGQRNLLVIMENLIIGSFSIVCGIGLGVVLAKLFFMAAGFLLETESLPFYLPWEAIGWTVGAFLILFLSITVFTLLFMGKTSTLELLKGNQKPKTEPKASVGLSILSAFLIGTGYVLSLTAWGGYVPLLLIPVTAIVITGSYFLFTQLSVSVIRLLKKNRSLYWHRTNLITMSDLAYRMKDNARMFFMVCIVSTVAFCAIGSLVSYADSIKQSALAINPYSFTYTAPKAFAQREEQRAFLEAELRAHDPEYRAEHATIRYQSGQANGEQYAVVKQSDYNRLANAIGWQTVSVSGNETILLHFGWDQNTKEISLPESGLRLQVKEQLFKSVISRPTVNASVMVVADDIYNHLPAKQEREWYGYEVNNWEDTFALSEKLRERFGTSAIDTYDLSSRADSYHPMKQMANTMLFVGLFVGILFFVAAGSFLYFRLYTDLDTDRRQYSAITKIGLTEQELSRIITTQIALLFFVPIVVAMIHSTVAFVALQSMLKLIGVTSVVKPTAIVLACFLAVQVAYFWVIRSRYLRHLKQAIG